MRGTPSASMGAMHPMPGSASISMVNAGLEAPPRLRCRETYASTSICVEAEPSISRSAVSRLAAAARALVFGQLPQCSARIQGPRLRNEQFRCEITVSKRRLNTTPLKPAVGVVPFSALCGGTPAHSTVKFSE